MSIFSKILSKIFPSSHAETPAQGSSGPIATERPNVAAPAPAAIPQVDVEAVLNGMASQHAEKLNWRTSIVDLLKLLGLDSSLAARKELASELHYSGSTDDSAAMNIWLHKQVMQKLAANGGKIPDDLKD
ncbi:DUF3597 domain-containing protein [Pigmentiphaga aceris]|uniref:DUF3597 domain-containing protein n=1 Tax=Pigmentiphaga aceris TaxID=1940612 RepID=A0A5C0AV35_9BURK|nr:DUF3597 domain-containing protein [Pigmentiphaga aceris]QEI05203.1 DUF3597 domain-containing protein [Pigmentiphaga aceris]